MYIAYTDKSLWFLMVNPRYACVKMISSPYGHTAWPDRRACTGCGQWPSPTDGALDPPGSATSEVGGSGWRAVRRRTRGPCPSPAWGRPFASGVCRSWSWEGASWFAAPWLPLGSMCSHQHHSVSRRRKKRRKKTCFILTKDWDWSCFTLLVNIAWVIFRLLWSYKWSTFEHICFLTSKSRRTFCSQNYLLFK